MSDKLFPLSLRHLLAWILEEEKSGQIFGFVREIFWEPHPDDPFRLERYGRLLETPVGVAAGPHTQLAQNIVSAYLMGARYIELKTVQTLDELDVPKPCIDMEDEGYNVEWSQELRLEQSFNEYLNAWILLHILRHHLGWDAFPEPGFIFNMSVGYNLAGILAPNVQHFLSKMENCHSEKVAKIEEIRTIYPAIEEIEIPDRISDNVTLSTMHGCPPDEIEQIASYLMEERGLHTTVKLNPTLLGAEELRGLLNQKLGFPVQVPDAALAHDPSYDEAAQMIRNLRRVAQRSGVYFGVKLSNTLETVNHRPVFPSSEKMAYLSGRALHPITVRLASRLQEDFSGELDISFSGGADAFNVADLVAAGLSPVTMCTDLLKPGGYSRLPQYLEELSKAMRAVGARSLDDFVLRKNSNAARTVSQAALENLRRYAQGVAEEKYYKKDFYPVKSIKSDRQLTAFDCISAPCTEKCAVHQDVPDYMYFAAAGNTAAAFDVILQTNPFPAVTGLACDHLCQTKCTRQNYDEPLQIREIKRYVAENASEAWLPAAEPPNGVRVGVIGAGPSGLSCAYFLRLAGCEVEVFEAKSHPGGMAAEAIPEFRLPREALLKDIRRIEKLGVDIHYGAVIDRELFEKLRSEKDFLYLSVGAQIGKKMGIPGEENPGVLDALEFLSRVKKNEKVALGQTVAVVGGGNTAMDAARTARRLVGNKGNVFIVYRRTRAEMPADQDEVKEAQAEGIELVELAAPVTIARKAGQLELTLQKMKLGEPDASGRRRPVPLKNAQFHLQVDAVITAIGQEMALDFLKKEDLQASPETGETRIPGLYIGGDALRGPSSLILAIADGKRAAENMLRAAGKPRHFAAPKSDKGLAPPDFQKMASQRKWAVHPKELPPQKRLNFQLVTQTFSAEDARKEASRCLLCDEICNVCVSVCPNRANLSYTIEPTHFPLQKIVLKTGQATIEPDGEFRAEQTYQVLNIADWCNECGNCTTFCPTSGAPYRDKPRFCLSEESFRDEPVAYKLEKKGREVVLRYKNAEREERLIYSGENYVYEVPEAVVELLASDFSVVKVSPKGKNLSDIHLHRAADMRLLLDNLKDSYWVNL